MQRYFHVTSTRNRDSIATFGLDWRRMGAARGIAGSDRPEAEGVFVCTEESVDFFLRLNNTGGPADVWAIDGIADGELRDNGTGFEYVPRPIPPEAVRLDRRDVPVDVRFGY